MTRPAEIIPSIRVSQPGRDVGNVLQSFDQDQSSREKHLVDERFFNYLKD
jgi:hypothetical protein